MSKPGHRSRNMQPARPDQPQNSTPQLSVRTATSVQWQGPLPPPEVLEKFNSVLPDGAARIVAMAEREQAHRIAIEAQGLVANVDEARRGQLLGACLSGLCIIGTISSVYLQADWRVSVALIGVPLLSTVRAVINRNTKTKPKG